VVRRKGGFRWVKSSGWRVAGGGESRGCSSGNGEEKDDAEAVEEKKSGGTAP